MTDIWFGKGQRLTGFVFRLSELNFNKKEDRWNFGRGEIDFSVQFSKLMLGSYYFVKKLKRFNDLLNLIKNVIEVVKMFRHNV